MGSTLRQGAPKKLSASSLSGFTSMGRLLKTRPRGYQGRGAQLVLDEKTVALFFDTRTGKTLTSFLALARLWRRGLVSKVVIFCPKSAIGVWKRQAKAHLNIPYTMSTLDDLCPQEGALNFLLVNYEATWRPRQKAAIQEFMSGDHAAAVTDEGHRIGNPRSRQSKAVGELGKAAEYRINLTGTPTDGDELELWGQFRFVRPQLLGDDWKQFESKWLRKAGYGNYDRKLKKHLRKDFYRLLSPYTFIIRRDEVLDLPPIDEYEIPFNLTGEAKRVYRELEDELYTEIAGETVVTPMRIQQMIRLQQVTGGFLNTDDAVIHLEQDKLATLRDWLYDYRKKKIVIFSRFTAEIDALKTVLGRDYSVGVLDGRTRDRTIWEQFQDKKDPQVLVIQTRTGGEAIECSAADVGVSYSKSWSSREFSQCRDRLIGQNKRIIFGHMTAEDTIDEDILSVVQKKGHKASAVLSNLKLRRRS